MAGGRPWRVRLTGNAEADVRSILLWTAERFGAAQANVYARTLTDALEALVEGPAIPGVKSRDDIAKGLFTLHVARGGRRGRHFVVFRIGHDRAGDVIDVLRLLHDAMDLERHVSKSDAPET